MTNPYYNPSGVPATRAQLSSSAVRTELAAVKTGFEKLAPTLTANALLHVNAAGTQQTAHASITVSAAGAVAGITDLAYTGTLTGGAGIVNLGSGQVYKDASGSLGLGMTAPTELGAGYVNVQVAGASGAIVQVQNAAGTVKGAMVSDPTSVRFGSRTAHPVLFTVNSNEVARIDASGNLGIGTVAPAYKLHVQGSSLGLVSASADAALTVAGSSTSALFGTDASGAYMAANGTSAARFVTSGVERMRLDGGGALFVTLPVASPTVPIGAMSFHRVSDTVVRLNMRGSDNIQRYVDLTLTP